MEEKSKFFGDFPSVNSASSSNTILILSNGSVKQIPLGNLTPLFSDALTEEQKQAISKISAIEIQSNKNKTSISTINSKLENNYQTKEIGKSLVSDIDIAKIHTHANETELNKISEDGEGNFLYDGEKIKLNLIDDTAPGNDITYSSNKIDSIKTELQTKIDDAITGGTVDLSNYYTKTQIDDKYAAIDHNHDTAYRKIEDSYTKDEIDKIYAKKTELNGNLLIANSQTEMTTLAKVANLGKILLYAGNDEDASNGLVKGEQFFLHWNAITINYAIFAYGGSIQLDYAKFKELTNGINSLTITATFGHNAEEIWHYTTSNGGSGSDLSKVGVYINAHTTVGDTIKITCTKNATTSISYSWLPLYIAPYTSKLIKNWFYTDKIVRYKNYIYNTATKDGKLFKLTGNTIAISTNDTALTDLTIDKEKFLNNCEYRGKIQFVWSEADNYFRFKQGYSSSSVITFTKEDLISYGISYTGDITDSKYIQVITSKEQDINNWNWIEVENSLSENTDINTNIWTGTKAEYNAITDKQDDMTYIVTDEEDNLDINSLVIDDTKTSDKTTWSSKKINESVSLKNTKVFQVVNAGGTTKFTLQLSTLNLKPGIYHFKMSIIGNSNIIYCAEGGLGNYDGHYGLDIAYKSGQITNITISGEMLSVTTGNTAYRVNLAIQSDNDWLVL